MRMELFFLLIYQGRNEKLAYITKRWKECCEEEEYCNIEIVKT